MKKRLLLHILALSLLLSLVAPAACATEVTEDTGAAIQESTQATEETTEATRPADACGEDLTWSYSGGTLTVTGTGAMDDFSGGAPWDAHKEDITSVVLTGGVTTVGAYAFKGYTALKSVSFGNSLREIGQGAFQNCTGLTEISLPASFRLFGPECFMGSSNLKEVWCAGGMPSFRSNCLWNGNKITIYHPSNNIWPAQYVEELERNFGGRLEVLSEDGTDHFTWDEETEPTEEATTEPATVPTTEPETEPTTVPTEETTVPTTEATEEVVETTEAPTETEEATEETEPALSEEVESKGWLMLVLTGVGLTALVAAALVIRWMTTKGGKYST